MVSGQGSSFKDVTDRVLVTNTVGLVLRVLSCIIVEDANLNMRILLCICFVLPANKTVLSDMLSFVKMEEAYASDLLIPAGEFTS